MSDYTANDIMTVVAARALKHVAEEDLPDGIGHVVQVTLARDARRWWVRRRERGAWP